MFLFLMKTRDFLMVSMKFSVFWQPTQPQFSSQKKPDVKHSQYILRHFDFVHLHLKSKSSGGFLLMTHSFISCFRAFSLAMVFLPLPLNLTFYWEDSRTELDSFLFSLVTGILRSSLKVILDESFLIGFLASGLSSTVSFLSAIRVSLLR